MNIFELILTVYRKYLKIQSTNFQEKQRILARKTLSQESIRGLTPPAEGPH